MKIRIWIYSSLISNDRQKVFDNGKEDVQDITIEPFGEEIHKVYSFAPNVHIIVQRKNNSIPSLHLVPHDAFYAEIVAENSLQVWKNGEKLKLPSKDEASIFHELTIKDHIKVTYSTLNSETKTIELIVISIDPFDYTKELYHLIKNSISLYVH